LSPTDVTKFQGNPLSGGVKYKGWDIFYLRDAVSAVLATATCLAGWLAGWVCGCPSHAGIVSKQLNLSEKVFNHLKAPSF